MKKLLLALFITAFIASSSFALQDIALNDSDVNSGNAPKQQSAITQYSPSLEIQFEHFFSSQAQSICFDEENNLYYGIGYNAGCETYDINGNLVNSVTIGVSSVRTCWMYNGDVYLKPFGTDLYIIDPETGATTTVFSDMFNDTNSEVCFSEGIIYEHYSETVWMFDIDTGEQVGQFTINGDNYDYPIATNGIHLFFEEAFYSTTIPVYDFDGNYVETITVPYGDWSWTLSHCNNLLFTGDHDNGNWYGYSGVEGIMCSDVDMVPDDDPIMVPQGGTFGLTGHIGNPNDDTLITDVWVGIIYLGDFYELWNFSNISLAPAQTLSAHLNQSVPVYAPTGTYTYISYSGEKPDACDSAFFEFTVTGARNSDGASEWLLEGGFYEDDATPSEYALNSNYPNPFNASTNIAYVISEPGDVNLEVFNLMGQKVAALVDNHQQSGHYTVTWNAADYPSGIYFYRLSSGGNVLTKRMTLLK